MGNKIRFTVMEAKGFNSHISAGNAIDAYEFVKEEIKGVYSYRLTYTNKGIIVQVCEGNKTLGYLG